MTDQSKPDAASPMDGTAPNPDAVELATPLKVDGAEVRFVTLRKPNAGELRGLKLVELMQMDVQSMLTVIPRISQPPLSEAQTASLDLVDITKFGVKIIGFFGDMSGAMDTPNIH